MSTIVIFFFGHTGKELNDPRVLTDVGDVPVQEIRDCGVDDDRLMNIISESVKLVMEEVRPCTLLLKLFNMFYILFDHLAGVLHGKYLIALSILTI